MAGIDFEGQYCGEGWMSLAPQILHVGSTIRGFTAHASGVNEIARLVSIFISIFPVPKSIVTKYHRDLSSTAAASAYNKWHDSGACGAVKGGSGPCAMLMQL